MAKRSVQLELIPLVNSNTKPDTGSADGYFGPMRHYLEVEVSYNEGGMNYFTGGRTARGYYLRAQPVTRQTTTHHDGTKGEMSGFMLGTGAATLLEPATRFSDKTLAKIAAGAKSRTTYEPFKASVIVRHGLILADVATAGDRCSQCGADEVTGCYCALDQGPREVTEAEADGYSAEGESAK